MFSVQFERAAYYWTELMVGDPREDLGILNFPQPLIVLVYMAAIAGMDANQTVVAMPLEGMLYRSLRSQGIWKNQLH